MIVTQERVNDLESYPDTARVWIYQADREIDAVQAERVNEAVQRFAAQWISHSQSLKATGGLLHQRFLVLVVNEYVAGVSGCSIDSSVAFVKQMGDALGVDFMDRMTFAYASLDGVQTVHKNDLATAYATGVVDDSTLFFDNLVNSKSDFVNRWMKPLGESWMKRFC